MREYKLARGLAIQTKFDDLDIISRSQVCQDQELQMVFRFLSTLMVHGCYTHKKDEARYVLCVTVVYLRDIANMIFVILHN